MGVTIAVGQIGVLLILSGWHLLSASAIRTLLWGNQNRTPQQYMIAVGCAMMSPILIHHLLFFLAGQPNNAMTWSTHLLFLLWAAAKGGVRGFVGDVRYLASIIHQAGQVWLVIGASMLLRAVHLGDLSVFLDVPDHVHAMSAFAVGDISGYPFAAYPRGMHAWLLFHDAWAPMDYLASAGHLWPVLLGQVAIAYFVVRKMRTLPALILLTLVFGVYDSSLFASFRWQIVRQQMLIPEVFAWANITLFIIGQNAIQRRGQWIAISMAWATCGLVNPLISMMMIVPLLVYLGVIINENRQRRFFLVSGPILMFLVSALWVMYGANIEYGAHGGGIAEDMDADEPVSTALTILLPKERYLDERFNLPAFGFTVVVGGFIALAAIISPAATNREKYGVPSFMAMLGCMHIFGIFGPTSSFPPMRTDIVLCLFYSLMLPSSVETYLQHIKKYCVTPDWYVGAALTATVFPRIQYRPSSDLIIALASFIALIAWFDTTPANDSEIKHEPMQIGTRWVVAAIIACLILNATVSNWTTTYHILG